jgi:hypothetical protein
MEPALQAHGASITGSRPNNGSTCARLWDQKLTFEVTATGPCAHRSPGHHVDVGHSLKSSVAARLPNGLRIAVHQRTVLAAHVPLKLMDRCRLRPANHIECNGLMRVASEAANFEIQRTQSSTEADRYAANVLPIIREAQKAGASTLRQVADALNARVSLRHAVGSGTQRA